MPKFFVSHTVDELGGTYEHLPNPEGPFGLSEARDYAEEYTRRGQCGFVVRDDGAVEAPDGTWLTEEAPDA
jgi:hypothetical protein